MHHIHLNADHRIAKRKQAHRIVACAA